MSKEELEKNQKSTGELTSSEKLISENINQPEKTEPVKKTEQINDPNTESEYTDHLGFDKKYWNNGEFQFPDLILQKQSESKLSIDDPNISKNRLQEYLNDDLINALDVSPKIPQQNINTPTSENDILSPNIDNTNCNELFQFSLYNNKKNSDKETSTKSINTKPKNLIEEIIKKNTEDEIEKNTKNNNNNNLINLDDNNKGHSEDESIEDTAYSSITKNIIKDNNNNNLINKNINVLPFMNEGSGNIIQNNEKNNNVEDVKDNDTNNKNNNKEDEKKIDNNLNNNIEDNKNNDINIKDNNINNDNNNNIINDLSNNKKEELKEDMKKIDINSINDNQNQNQNINTTTQTQQTHLNPYHLYNIRENKFDVTKKYVIPVANPHLNQKKNTGYKPKKPFEVRVGDWTCSDCGNLNFAFRSKCNRCGLLKEVSIQKRRKTEQEQQFFYNPSNPENSMINFNGVMVPLRNKNEQFNSKFLNNPGYVIIFGQPQLMFKNQKNKEITTQETSNTNNNINNNTNNNINNNTINNISDNANNNTINNISNNANNNTNNNTNNINDVANNNTNNNINDVTNNNLDNNINDNANNNSNNNRSDNANNNINDNKSDNANNNINDNGNNNTNNNNVIDDNSNNRINEQEDKKENDKKE